MSKNKTATNSEKRTRATTAPASEKPAAPSTDTSTPAARKAHPVEPVIVHLTKDKV